MATILAFYIAGAGAVQQPPLFVNPYDPRLGGINCNEDCSHFGNGWEVRPELAGLVAACHPNQIGCSFIIRNEQGQAGPFLCIESGGALLEPRFNPKFGLIVQYFDIYMELTGPDGKLDYNRLPWWNHTLFYDYEVDCS